MKYFQNCKTAEELKKAFYHEAKRLHPDNGGSAEEFKKMKAEYEKMFDLLKNVHKTATGETWTATGDKATKETASEFADIIEKFIHFEGITIEIIGSWIWITGNTFQIKEELKKAGFKFSSKKKAWYFHYGPYKKHSKKNHSMDDLREMWGSEEFEQEPQKKIA
jgi:curved DNA-binding protein CbpA